MCKKLIVLTLSLCLISSVGAVTVNWDFENGNDHNFSLWSVSPPAFAFEEPNIAGEELLTGIGGPAGLPDAGVAWTVGPPDQFDGLTPAVVEGCHVVNGLLQYGPCNDPFGYTGGTPNSRGQIGYLNTYNLSQWGDNLHVQENDQIATSPVAILGENAVLTVWSHGGGSSTHAPEYDSDPANMYTDGSSGIVVLSAEADDKYAILATVHTQGKSTLTEDTLDLSAFAGRKVMIDVVDAFEGGWGWLAIDEIQITNTASKNAMLVVVNADLSAGFDEAEYDRLASLGYAVTVVESGELTDGSVTIDDCNGFDLLIISESIMSYEADSLIGTTTPIMHNESHGWDNWSFQGTPVNQGWRSGSEVNIVNDTHPIVVDANVSMGPMQFFDPQGEWTTELVSALAPGAEILASATIDGDDFAIVFAIEEGAELADGTQATARSVGFSLPGQAQMDPEVMTDEAWALWDASINWLDPPPQPMPTKIACVGDSITWGWSVSDREHKSYPAVLQTLLGSQYTVENFGTSGATVLKNGDLPYWNVANFKASTDFEPNVVVIMLGSNDAKPQNWSKKAEFPADYHSLIDHYRALGALVYVATLPPVYGSGNFGITPTVVNEIFLLVRQIAADADAPLIDVYTALSGKESLFPDKVHPNDEGTELIAQTVAAALEQVVSNGLLATTVSSN